MRTFRLFTFFLCTTLCLGFLSCEKTTVVEKEPVEEDGGGSSSKSLVGTWYYEDDDCYEEFEFKANGTVILTYEDYYYDEVDTERGEYTYRNGAITIYVEDEEVTIEVVSISSKSLVLKNEDGEKRTFKRG